MKIQIGSTYMNKTTKYLAPCLRDYGEMFRNKIRSVSKLAIGVGDMVLIDKNVALEKHIFILIDTKTNVTTFIDFLAYIRIQDYYEDDYIFDDANTGRKHMVVISIPEKYTKTLDNFKNNKFSEMYTLEDVNRLFKEDVQKVLIKDHNYKVEFGKNVNKIYNSTVEAEEWDGELDFPINLKEEIFNNE